MGYTTRSSANATPVAVYLILSITVISMLGGCALTKTTPFTYGHIAPDSSYNLQPVRDTSIAARVIFDKGLIKVNYPEITVERTRHKRIEILKKEGVEFADISIPFHEDDAVSRIKAQTILPNGETVELSRKNITENELPYDRKLVKFSIPGAREGSIIEYSYMMTSRNLAIIKPWYFQSEIPTNMSSVSLEMSPGFIYNAVLQNMDPTYKPDVKEILQTDGKPSLERYSWTFYHLDPIRPEPYMTAPSDYMGALHMELNGFRGPGTWVDFSKDWNELTERIYTTYFKQFINGDRRIRDKVEELTENEKGDYNKAKVLYDFVRDRFVNEPEPYVYYDYESPSSLLESESAKPIEQNLLLVAMLQEAGIDAYPVLISTRKHGKVFRDIPRLSYFNHMIIYSKIYGEHTLMDPSAEYMPYGKLPAKDYNGLGLKISDSGADFVNTGKPDFMSMKHYMVQNAEIDSEGGLTIDAIMRFEGYSNVSMRNDLENDDKPESVLESYFEDFSSEIEVQEVKVTGLETVEEPIAFTTKLHIPEFVMMNGDFAYFSPTLIFGELESVFTSDKRYTNIDYVYPRIEMSNINIQIPDGYIVEEVPESRQFKVQGHEFQRMVSRSDSTLTMARKFQISKRVINKAYYDDVREFYSALIKADQDQVVLRRSEKQASKGK